VYLVSGVLATDLVFFFFFVLFSCGRGKRFKIAPRRHVVWSVGDQLQI